MGRKETGFLRSMFNALTGTGVTVRRTTDFWGNRKTIVHDYNSGTRKEYSHDRGLFSNRTDVRIKRHGKQIGKGSIKTDIFGNSRETLEYSEGKTRKTVKNYNRGFFGNKDETVHYDKDGKVIGHRKGKHTLIFDYYTQEYTGTCYCCNGTGTHRSGTTCRKCGGSGIYRKKKS